MNKPIQIGFTLIELLVVIAIVGILSGLIIVGMNNSVSSARIAKAQIFASSLRDSLLMNLISEWKFDGSGINDGGTLDTSSTYLKDTWASENATIGVAPLVYSGSNCVYGSCLSFNGTSQYLSIPDDPVFNFGTQMTAMVWAKGGAGSGSSQCFFGQYLANDTGRAWYMRKANASPYSKVEIVITADSITTYSYTSNAVAFDNNWHLLGFTFNSGAYKVYVDGNLSSFGTSPVTTIYDPSSNLTIGAIANPTYFFTGYIDEARLYNVAIPTSKIREQYYAGINKLLAKYGITKNDYQNRVEELINIAAKI